MQDLHLARIVGGAGRGRRIDEQRYLSGACAVGTATTELLQARLGTVPAMFANEAAIL